MIGNAILGFIFGFIIGLIAHIIFYDHIQKFWDYLEKIKK